MTGVGDAPYYEFLGKLLDGKINFRKAIKRQKFKELYRLNYDRFEGRLWDQDHQNGLLVATRYGNNPRLWRCWPLGRVEERQMSAIGSGGEYAVEYIRSKDILRPHGIGLSQTIAFSAEAIERASMDIHTAGLDIAVILPEGINEHGKSISQAIKNARKKEIDSLMTQYENQRKNHQRR